MITFVDQVYLPDLLAIAPYYLDYAKVGEGLGNFLTWASSQTRTTAIYRNCLCRALLSRPGLDQYPGTGSA